MAEITKLEATIKTIQAMKDQIQPLLKTDTDKFLQIACNFLTANQKLLECSSVSILSSIMKAAQCGLFIDGQEASLVPFSGSATMMTGYKGILKMVRNSGELASINAGVVYEKDEFEYYVDEKGEHIKHKPSFVKDRGLPTQTYCIARTKGSKEPYIEVMSEEEISACKNSSNAVKKGYDTPWKGVFADEMRKKTVIRRISKRLPMSTDMNIAISSDDEIFSTLPTVDENTDQAPVAAAPVTAPTQSRLEQAVGATAPVVPQGTAEDLKKTFSQKVHGTLVTVSAKGYPTETDPNRTRFSTKLDDKFFGTFNKEIYLKIEDLYNRKALVEIEFVVQLNSQKQPYNEILNVIEVVSDEENPL